MENIKKVICDLDGVILDYVQAYIKWTHPQYNDNEIKKLVSKVVKWDSLLKVTGTTFSDLKNIQNHTNFIATIEKYPNSDKIIETLIKTFGRDKLCFLTAVTHHHRETQIEELYPDVPLFCGHQKEFWANPNYLLIDDHPKNCLKWKDRGGIFHLYRQPWNNDDPLHESSYPIDW
jgi:5'(3')-deoxyribonucleotidase